MHEHPDQDVAAHLSSVAEIVADRLCAACNARAFVKALEANHRLWVDLCLAAQEYGWTISERAAHFALQVSGRPDRVIDDHDVEMLININRAVARTINDNVAAAHGFNTTLMQPSSFSRNVL